MGDLTPQQELRAAAETLRKAAGRTDAREEWADFYGESTEADLPEDDRQWLALMNPDLSEPLAGWLDSIADGLKHISDPRNQAIVAGRHALAAARVINGGGHG